MRPYSGKPNPGKFTGWRYDCGFVGSPPNGIVDKTWHLRSLNRESVRNANRTFRKSARQAGLKDIKLQAEEDESGIS